MFSNFVPKMVPFMR